MGEVLTILKRRIYHGKQHETKLSDLKIAELEILDWVDEIIRTAPPQLYEGADTEAKATERYIHGGFGGLKTKIAYKRYSDYIEWLRNRKSAPKTKDGTDA